MFSPCSVILHRLGRVQPPARGLGGATLFAIAQLSQPELHVMAQFLALPQHLRQPLFSDFGEAKVTDCGMVVVHDVTSTGRRRVAVSSGRDAILAGVQQPPVVTTSN